MDARSKYTSVLVAYYAGVATDLPAISPYARDLARVPRSAIIPEFALIRAYLTDPFLCAKLCGVANSIFFNYDHQAIYTLRDSFDRVGFAYARNLLSQAPELPRNIDEEQVGAYWAHCMAVAHGAKRIAGVSTHAPFHEDVAYLVGMVHDIGYLLQLHYSPDMLPAVTRALETGEAKGGSNSHASHGEELARYWALPPPAIAAIKWHHDPDECDEGRGRWLSQVIAVSEMLIGAVPSESREVPDTACFAECTRTLGISNAHLAAIKREAVRVYEDCIQVVSKDRSGARSRSAITLKVVK